MEKAELRHFVDTLKTKEQWFVLDTETTGLHTGEICQLCILDNTGFVWFNNLIKPVHGIPQDATNIHGITDDMVKDAPMWKDVMHVYADFLADETCVVYNAIYDRKMMHKSSEAAGIEPYEWKEHTEFLCAMIAFSEYYGEWNSYHGNYRWQNLAHAARFCKMDVGRTHTALDDCKLALGVTKFLIENTPDDLTERD